MLWVLKLSLKGIKLIWVGKFVLGIDMSLVGVWENWYYKGIDGVKFC